MSNAAEPAPDLSGPALRTFVGITREWSLSAAERAAILGGRNPETLVSLTDEELLRLSYIVGIYKDINILLPLPDRANRWIRAANGAFAGVSALELMVSEGLEGLKRVREYLAAQTS